MWTIFNSYHKHCKPYVGAKLKEIAETAQQSLLVLSSIAVCLGNTIIEHYHCYMIGNQADIMLMNV